MPYRHLLILSLAAALAAAPDAARADSAAAALIQSSRPPVPSTPQPAVERERAASVVTERAVPAAAARTDTGPTFLLRSVLLQGNTLLTQGQLDAITRQYIGRRVTFGDLTAMTRAIERAYRERGHLLTTAVLPAQKVSRGEVRVDITEGKLGQVRVEGNKHYRERFVRRFFHPYDRHGVVGIQPVTRSLLVLNEFNDLAVQSVFVRGAQPGTTDVTLKVKDAAPLHVDVAYDNFGNRLIGRNRAAIGVDGGNVLASGDDMIARYTEPFPSLSDPFYQFAYTLPLGTHGDRLGVSFLRARTVVDPTAGIGIIPGTNGAADVYALTWQKALDRRLDRSSNLATSFYAKSIQNFVLGSFPIGNDQIRSLSTAYSIVSADKKGRWIATGGLTAGLGTAFGGIANDNPQHGRVGAGNQFVKANLDALRVQSLGKKDSLLVRFSGQAASDPQVSAEQFAIGGPDSVRGYIQAEQLGDNGYSTSLELRHELFQKNRSNVQALAFIDYGHVRNELPTPADGARDLTGAGVGARATIDGNTTLRTDLGVPITPNPDSLGYHSMLYAQLAHRF